MIQSTIPYKYQSFRTTDILLINALTTLLVVALASVMVLPVQSCSSHDHRHHLRASAKPLEHPNRLLRHNPLSPIPMELDDSPDSHECASAEPTLAEQVEMGLALHHWKVDHGLLPDAQGNWGGSRRRRNLATVRYEIPVYFHILQYNDTLGAVTSEEIVNNYMKLLNDEYAKEPSATPQVTRDDAEENRRLFKRSKTKKRNSKSSKSSKTPKSSKSSAVQGQNDDTEGANPFTFSLKGISRTINPDWYYCNISNELEFKSVLKVPGKGVMNVYLCDSYTGQGGAFGWSTLPTQAGSVEDGIVNVHPDTKVGPKEAYYTLVHEVGHWLGLFHTFTGGCNSSGWEYEGYKLSGDGVTDTPAQAIPTWRIKTGRDQCWKGLVIDSCPDNNPEEGAEVIDPGFDLVHNIMNYIPATCLEERSEFTPGQIERMLAEYEMYRL